MRGICKILALLACCSPAAAAEYPTPQAQTSYSSVYYLDGSFKISWAYLAINLKAAQALKLTGKGVGIAVFDTGLDVTNPKFQGNLITGWNIYGNNGQGELSVTRDNSYHGTFVSGIIAANTLTGQGSNTYGIAPEAKIMPIQIFDENGLGRWTDQQFYTAINYAMLGIQKTPIVGTTKVGVFNNSWNSNLTLADIGYNTAWINSTYRMSLYGWNLAAQRNILNVWAAGNFSKPDPGYFATMPSIDPRLASSWIVVVATDRTGALASYSNACGIAASYCMAAPGSNILGVYTNASGTNTLAAGSGTSFAAPMVSASAALLWQWWPYLKAWEVQQILFRSADKTGIYANTALYGQGLLNLTRAFDPIGTLKVATTSTVSGSNTAITGTYVAPGGVLEGPLLAGLKGQSMMVLDDFNRGYQVNLSQGVVRNASQTRWNEQFGLFGSRVTQQGSATLISGSVEGEPAALAYTSSGMGITSAAGQNVNPALAYGVFANGSLRGTDLVFNDTVGNPYMNLAPQSTSWANSIDWGSGQLTRLGAWTNTWWQDPLGLNQDLPRMSGANVEHTVRWGSTWASWNVGMVDETGTLLGGRSGGVLGLGNGSSTLFTGINFGTELPRGFTAFAGANLGYTWTKGQLGQVVTSVQDLTSGDAYAGIAKQGIFGLNDRFGIVAGLPLSLGYGQINLRLPTDRDMEGNVSFTNQAVSLRPSQPSWSLQAFYDTTVYGVHDIGFGVGFRSNSVQHNGEDDLVGMARYRLRF